MLIRLATLRGLAHYIILGPTFQAPYVSLSLFESHLSCVLVTVLLGTRLRAVMIEGEEGHEEGRRNGYRAK